MEKGMGTANVFAFYGVVSLIAVPYIYFLIPETRGRTLLEIEEYFKTGLMSAPLEVQIVKGNTDHTNEDDECKESFLKT